MLFGMIQLIKSLPGLKFHFRVPCFICILLVWFVVLIYQSDTVSANNSNIVLVGEKNPSILLQLCNFVPL